jgi:hypothetical protein
MSLFFSGCLCSCQFDSPQLSLSCGLILVALVINFGHASLPNHQVHEKGGNRVKAHTNQFAFPSTPEKRMKKLRHERVVSSLLGVNPQCS